MIKLIILIFLSVNLSLPQGLLDGVRLVQRQNGVDARSTALGISYQGLIDNGSALYFNPAGLSLVPSQEVSLGLGVLVAHNDNIYLGNSLSSDYSSEYIKNATIVLPFGDSESNFTFAFGYFNDNDYELTTTLSGFNQRNSFIGFLVDNGNEVPTRLEIGGGENGNFFTPIRDSVQQDLRLFESGNVDRITLGFSFDLSEMVAIGFSGAARLGEFNESFFLDEFDRENIYSNLEEDYSNVDFRLMQFENRIRQEFQSVTGTIGIIAKLTKNSRFNFALDLPEFTSVQYGFREDAYAEFDNGDKSDYFFPANPNQYQELEYEVIMPMKFRMGYSINLLGLTATIGAEYTDLNNMEFQSTLPSIEDLNFGIPEELGAQFTWGFGAEYRLPIYPLFLRASYSEMTNPWVNSALDLGAARNVGVGGGLLLGKNIMIDVTYAVRLWNEGRYLYGNENPYRMEHTISNFVIGLNYRY